MMRAALALALALFSAPALAQCRQALALALDVSGSVDSREYRLQLDGLAGALDAPRVRSALLAMPSAPVDIAVFEWSGTEHQAVLVGWTVIDSADTIDRIAATLRRTVRQEAPPGTALGTAMATGRALLAQRPQCWKRTLDISGDGKRNIGPHPRDIRPMLERDGITVNALVIGADAPAFGDLRQSDISELSSYFKAYVIAGPDAFVQTALGFETYREAMERKLLRELQVLALSAR